MKKYCLLILCLAISTVFLSACQQQPKQSMVKAERRLGKYFKDSAIPNGSVVDLSEGPKLKYDAKLGPRDLDFDVKVKDPYW
ncbi:MAG: hypothetical protein MJ231_00450 [bacterium]|nr:hypothetical protein [bacterium]